MVCSRHSILPIAVGAGQFHQRQADQTTLPPPVGPYIDRVTPHELWASRANATGPPEAGFDGAESALRDGALFEDAL